LFEDLSVVNDSIMLWSVRGWVPGTESLMGNYTLILQHFKTADNQQFSIQLWRNPDSPGANDYSYTTKWAKMTVANNAFSFEIASDMSDAVRWLVSAKYLVAGTETSEWVVPPGVSATSVQAVLNSRNGSADIQGTAIGDAVVFFQAGKRSVREYYIAEQDDRFRSNNLAMMAPQMLSESPAVDFDFVSAPYTRLIVVREDGSAVCLLYERNAGVFAWSRLVLSSGKIRSCATAPAANGYDDIYLAVETTGGSFYLERLREPTATSVYRDGHQNGAGGTGYEAVMESMPVVTAGGERPKRIAQIAIRFKESFFPVVEALPGEARQVITGRTEPYTGVVKLPFPGAFDRDVFFRLVAGQDAPCTILSVNAEAGPGGLEG
jgi:hypothetical protein